VQSTIQLPQTAPLEPLAAKLERFQSDALDIIHQVMRAAADSVTTPQQADAEDPATQAHARTITQRMRIALTAAREILRFVLPDQSGDSPGSSRATSTGKAATSQRSSAARAPRELVATAGTATGRFSEQITPSGDSPPVSEPASPLSLAAPLSDAQPTTQDRAPDPSAAPTIAARSTRPPKDTRFLRQSGEMYNDFIRRRGTPYVPKAPPPASSGSATPSGA
jgi:hypothetical protein